MCSEEDLSESSDEDLFDSTPPDLKESALKCKEKMIPQKSKETYERHWNNFEKWIIQKKVSKISENVMLAYFNELMEKYKASSLWTILSAIKAVSKTKPNVELGELESIQAVLKQKQAKEKKKKSAVFTRDQMDKFFQEAHGMEYLVPKLTLLFGVTGALRREELHKLRICDISIYSDHLMIHVPSSKTDRAGNGRNFIILKDEEHPWKCPLILYSTYLKSLRFHLNPSDRIWRQYRSTSNGFTRQVYGINNIGKIPKLIAQFLKLDNPKSYTGHAFRRTGATLAADKGIDMINLKRLGGWKSDSVAEGYIAESEASKKRIASVIQDVGPIENKKQKIQEDKDQEKTVHLRNLTLNNLHNCQITIYCNQPPPIGVNKKAQEQ
jgi:integrase